MAKRIDVDRREKRPNGRSKRKPLPIGKMWRVVGGLFLIFTGLVAFFWLIGADFDSEHRRAAWFSMSNLIGEESRGTRLSACGIARALLPEAIHGAIPCVWWNVGSFFIVPVIALVYAIKASLSRC